MAGRTPLPGHVPGTGRSDGRGGRTCRRGLPPWAYTYAGRRLRKKWAQEAAVKAHRIVENMSKQVEFGDDRAKTAIEAAVAIIVEKSTAKRADGLDDFMCSPKDRLAAIKLVLDFTQSKPATQTVQKLTIETAEDWLKSLDTE